MDFFTDTDLLWKDITPESLKNKYPIEPQWLSKERLEGLTDSYIYNKLAEWCDSDELPQEFVDHFVEIDHHNLMLRYLGRLNLKHLKRFLALNKVVPFRFKKPINFKPVIVNKDRSLEHCRNFLRANDKIDVNDFNDSEMIDLILNAEDEYLRNMALIEIIFKYENLNIDQQIKTKNEFLKYDNERRLSIISNDEALSFVDSVLDNWIKDSIICYHDSNHILLESNLCIKVLLSFPNLRKYIIINQLKNFNYYNFWTVFEEDISEEVVKIVEELVDKMEESNKQ